MQHADVDGCARHSTKWIVSAASLLGDITATSDERDNLATPRFAAPCSSQPDVPVAGGDRSNGVGHRVHPIHNTAQRTALHRGIVQNSVIVLRHPILHSHRGAGSW
ncbi:MAG: hypothetical protein ACKOAT_01720, partial [Actinomycetota bacterium]